MSEEKKNLINEKKQKQNKSIKIKIKKSQENLIKISQNI
jgi:hypothetical protein